MFMFGTAANSLSSRVEFLPLWCHPERRRSRREGPYDSGSLRCCG